MTDPIDYLDFTGAGALFGAPEDYLLAVLKPLEGLIPGLKVRTMIEDDLTCPYLLCRSAFGAWGSGSDSRFARKFTADIQTWTEDGTEPGSPSGDTRGAWLQEIVRLRLATAWRNQETLPGLGHFSHFEASTDAHRVADWATSTGAQQYANLPKSLTRYEAKYSVAVRPDFANPLTVSDLIADLSN